MNFHQALAARYGVQHLAFGGALGQIVNPIAETWHGVTGAGQNNFTPEMPTNTFQAQMPTNTFQPNMPTNSFQASAPAIDQMNFKPGAEAGMAGYNAGAAGLGGTFGAQTSLAQQAGQTLGAQQGLYGQQQSLADALMAQSRGQGPNPAQMQFQQNMNQAIAQQAGTVGSTRGINPALAARMAAQQGAAMQQQGVGQAGVLGAQQQLAAQQQLGQQQQAMGQNLLGQNQTFANQGNLYGAAAGTAGTLGGLGNQMYGTSVQGQNAQNQVLTQGQLGAQGINAGVASQNAQLGAAGQQLAAGVAEQNANLGAQGQALNAGVANSNLQSGIAGQQIQSGVAQGNAAQKGAITTGITSGVLQAAGAAAEKGATGKYRGGEIHDQKAVSLAQALMGRGGEVPGKAKVAGDDEENDTVPTVLSPDEIVIPRSIATSEDAPEKAAEFVAHLKGKSKSGAKGYGKILEKHRDVQKRMAELESLIKRSAS